MKKKKLCVKKNYIEWLDYVKDFVFSCEFWWNRCLNMIVVIKILENVKKLGLL